MFKHILRKQTNPPVPTEITFLSYLDKLFHLGVALDAVHVSASLGGEVADPGGHVDHARGGIYSTLEAQGFVRIVSQLGVHLRG